MRRLLPGAALALCAALPVHAGLFNDDEARAAAEKARAGLVELGARVDQSAKNQIELGNTLEALKDDMARLRGQIEVLTNDLADTQKRQKDFYIDLDNRLRKLESPAPAAEKAEAKVDPANEVREFEAALQAVKGGQHKEAQAGFEAFIKAYPASSFLPSAHYWLATSSMQLKDYPRAAAAFGALAEKWPNDARAPAALLGRADAFKAAGDIKNAKLALETLVEKYPASDAAKAAKPRLAKSAARK